MSLSVPAGITRPVLCTILSGSTTAGGRLFRGVNTAPAIAKRIAAGDVFDVLISPPAGIEQFAKAGKVGTEHRVNVGKVGLGIAVRPGAPVPDISSVDAVKRSVLEAE